MNKTDEKNLITYTSNLNFNKLLNMGGELLNDCKKAPLDLRSNSNEGPDLDLRDIVMVNSCLASKPY